MKDHKATPPSGGGILSARAAAEQLIVAPVNDMVLFPNSTIALGYQRDQVLVAKLMTLAEHGEGQLGRLFVSAYDPMMAKTEKPEDRFYRTGVIVEVLYPYRIMKFSPRHNLFGFRGRALGRAHIVRFIEGSVPLMAEIAVRLDNPAIALSVPLDDNAKRYLAACGNLMRVVAELLDRAEEEEEYVHFGYAGERLQEAVAKMSFIDVEQAVFGIREADVAVTSMSAGAYLYGLVPLCGVIWAEKIPTLTTSLQEMLEIDDPVRRIELVTHLFTDVLQFRKMLSPGEQRSDPGEAASEQPEVEKVDLQADLVARIGRNAEVAQREVQNVSVGDYDSEKGSMIRLDIDRAHPLTAEVKKFLGKFLIGQDRIAERLIWPFETLFAGVAERAGPLHSFMLLGPSGAGKTLALELLAELAFDDREAFSKINCADYASPHGIAQLLGAPPGYVSWMDPRTSEEMQKYPLLNQWNIDKHHYMAVHGREFATLMEEIAERKHELEELKYSKSGADAKRREQDLHRRLFELEQKTAGRRYRSQDGYYSIVGFDEIERAAPELHNVILAITDKGKAQLQNGWPVNFRRSLVGMTSNVGEEEIQNILKGQKTIGLHVAQRSFEKRDREIYEMAKDHAKKHFGAPFIGRLDDLIVVRPLTPEAIADIFDLELFLHQRILRRSGVDISLLIDRRLKEYIVEESLDEPELGVRLLKNKIRAVLSRGVTRLHLTGQIHSGDTLTVYFENYEDWKREPKTTDPRYGFYKKEGHREQRLDA